MSDGPFLPGFEPPKVADYASAAASIERRDNAPYLAALRQFRDAVASAERLIGGPVMIETKTVKRRGRVSLAVTFRPAVGCGP